MEVILQFKDKTKRVFKNTFIDAKFIITNPVSRVARILLGSTAQARQVEAIKYRDRSLSFATSSLFKE
jgi:hypothetical protein